MNRKGEGRSPHLAHVAVLSRRMITGEGSMIWACVASNLAHDVGAFLDGQSQERGREVGGQADEGVGAFSLGKRVGLREERFRNVATQMKRALVKKSGDFAVLYLLVVVLRSGSAKTRCLRSPPASVSHSLTILARSLSEL
ncbi:hypothetical protein MRB53_028289 [Persea americana]|uniref:Uncharacterized protein n=1 Tax=Persea americana TaxID=3435 RepID=A0ACC2KF49_PERAE|nr:hypothetical protein MRB53_028289 [Persea americana]